jgi:hypothetical protein
MTRASAALAAAVVMGALGAPNAQADEPSVPANTAPVAVPDALQMVSGATVRIDPRLNDSDPDGEPLSIVSAVVQAGAGSVAVEGVAPTQVLVIQAAAELVGPLVISYTITDPRGGLAQSTVTADVVAPTPAPETPVTPEVPAPVNHRPVAVKDVLRVQAGSGKSRVSVLANDTDSDGDRIKLVKVKRTTKGKATRSGQKIVYRAPKKWSGTLKVPYKIRDSRGATDWGVLKVKVKAAPKPRTKPVPTRSGTPTSGQVESALSRLGLPTGWVNGTYDQSTRRAVCAWRTVMGRTAHRGLPTAKEARAIVATSRLPRAQAYMVPGVNISITCQAVFWVSQQDTYRRIMPGSSGMPGYRTRLGTWRVFITRTTWRYSTIYPEARMYKPMQFSGGQAIHGSATDSLVKTYPASHGCVRMLHRDIDALQAGGVRNGTLVKVFGIWKG